MELTPEQAAGFRAAHASMGRILRGAGTEPDYSTSSLEGLEQAIARFRRGEELPGQSPADEHTFQVRAGAYAAEVLLRAVPGAKLSVVDREMSVTLPSTAVPGLTFKAWPRLQVVRLLQGDEDASLLAWAVVLLVLAGSPSPTTSGGEAPGGDHGQ